MKALEKIGTAAKWTWTVVAGLVTTAFTGAAPVPGDPGPSEDPDDGVSPEPRETP